MNMLINALVPVFAVMAFGALAERGRRLPVDTGVVLNRFVYYIGLPLLLFASLAETNIDEILRWNFIGGFALGMLGCYLVMFLLSGLMLKNHYTQSGMLASIASFPNVAFIGIPLLLGLYPDSPDGMVAVALTSMLCNIIVVLLLIKLEVSQAGGTKRSEIVKLLSKSVLLNPLILSVVFGIAWSAMGLPLPALIASPFHMLGQTAAPLALFAIGMGLVGPRPTRGGEKIRTDDVALATFCKLVLQPLLTFIALLALGVEGAWLQMGVLLSALPSATTICVVAEKYGIFRHGSIRVMFATTLLVILTLPALQLGLQALS